jgi:CubicO group peptidase (beta-lactamase class C family)
MNLIENKVVPGFSYGIYDGEEYLGAVGYKQIFPFKENTTIDTLYDIASLTKVIVIVPLICKMVDNKLISFNDKVKEYLPDFKYDDITIYHLLVHTSGLPASFSRDKILSQNEFIEKVYQQEKVYETESNILYSDLGYILLGFIIEKIYNKSLDIVANEQIFSPLEMFSTTYNPFNKEKCAATEKTDNRGLLKGIVDDEKAYSLNGIAGHAGVFSTSCDLLKFVKMVLNSGVYNHQQFLCDSMIDLWFRNLVYEKDNNRTRSLCWITGTNNILIKGRLNTISFTGFTGTSISIDRDNNIGIVLLSNKIHPTRVNNSFLAERPLIVDDIYNILEKEDVKQLRKHKL